MLFTSLEFFVFLPLVLLVFATLPIWQRWLWLLLASYVFYGIWQPFNLVYLGAVTLVVYVCGLGMQDTPDGRRRTGFLTIGLIAVLGSLFAFKFYDFIASELERLSAQLAGTEAPFALPRIGMTAPAGYSFYAFSAASYLIDVYVRRLPEKQSAGHAALYVAYFPKIFAGPIERATTFLPQVWSGLRSDPDRLVLGMQLIGWGLFKKVVIADNLAPLVDRNFAIAAFAPPMELLISVYFFAFQIYCDFSGYTDIAIGVSLLFGIQLMENFRRPYLSRSTGEFWASRWHISLGHWFRDYLYIPLGGSQAGVARQYLNLMIVFLVSGLWHAGLGYGVGWTFLVWGALNGLYQWMGLATRSFWRRIGASVPRIAGGVPLLVVRILVTFHLIAIAWVFFRASTVSEAITIVQKVGMRIPELLALVPRYPFTAEHYSGFALIGFLVVVEIFDERRSIFQRLAAAPVWLRWAIYYLVIFALLLLGRWQAKEFIYMQF
jgi:D-alanyl-lipoteichoic acid acyltransferase DltB (MBOAT superfamily)